MRLSVGQARDFGERLLQAAAVVEAINSGGASMLQSPDGRRADEE
jgi:hypothetical protein